MNNSVVGYCLLFFLFLPIVISVLRINGGARNISRFFFAGNRLTYPMLAATVFMSWMWTTTILGAGEAGIRYGFSGGWAYSLGATGGFIFFIPLYLRMLKRDPGVVTLTGFMEKRYGTKIRDLFYFFSIAVVVYIVIEQAAGIGTIFSNSFGISFKIAAFMPVVIISVFVSFKGMRGVIILDLVLFFLFSLVFLILCGDLLFQIDWNLFPPPIKELENPEGFSSIVSLPGLRYAVTAVFIAAGQVYLDPGYYAKAKAARNRQVLVRGFLIGGVVTWVPVSIICAFLFGSLGESYPGALNLARVPVLFSFLVLLAGITSISHCLMGMQVIFGTDYYSTKITKKASVAEKIRFSRATTILLGFLCGLIALALERISLLSIDIVSGIIFAAPCGSLILGVFSGMGKEKDALFSILLGVLSGFGSLILFGGDERGMFLATLLSFSIPLIYLLLLCFYTKIAGCSGKPKNRL